MGVFVGEGIDVLVFEGTGVTVFVGIDVGGTGVSMAVEVGMMEVGGK